MAGKPLRQVLLGLVGERHQTHATAHKKKEVLCLERIKKAQKSKKKEF